MNWPVESNNCQCDVSAEWSNSFAWRLLEIHWPKRFRGKFTGYRAWSVRMAHPESLSTRPL